MIDEHVKLFWQLWESFVIVLKHANKVKARVFIELPRQCYYWKDSRITSVLEQHGIVNADFDGCQYGLVAKHGKEIGHPINKPWRIATLRSTLSNTLHKVCDGKHALCHTKCGGANTGDPVLHAVHC